MFKVRQKQKLLKGYPFNGTTNRKNWHDKGYSTYKLLSNSFRKPTNKEDYNIVLKNKKEEYFLIEGAPTEDKLKNKTNYTQDMSVNKGISLLPIC